MIVYETANLYLFRIAPGCFEIRLNGNIHAVLVGTVDNEQRARRTMDRLERYPRQLRAFMNHPPHRQREN